MTLSIFDHHCHADLRNATDYELMAIAGVEKMLAPSSSTMERRHDGRAYAEGFDRLLRETERARQFGVELWVGLAMHAAAIGDPAGVDDGLRELEARLDGGRVVAVGELGFRDFSDLEIDLFRAQIRLAGRRRLPVLIEAPIATDDCRRMLDLLRQEIAGRHIESAAVCVLDLDAEKLALAEALDLGGYGLAVSPRFPGPFNLRRRLDDTEIVDLLARRGPHGLMLNSGLHYGYADPIGLPRCLWRLRLAGIDDRVLRALAHDHAARLFLDP